MIDVESVATLPVLMITVDIHILGKVVHRVQVFELQIL